MKYGIALLILLTLAFPVQAQAAVVESGAEYCFSQEDFLNATQGAALLETPESGVLSLGSRILRAGDVLTRQQLENVTFVPNRTETDSQAAIVFLPVGETGVGAETTFSLGIRGKENKPPVAEDSALETYKNLPSTGTLRASDPEGERLTYTLTRQPRRGTVELGADGRFTYTPKNNKVGVDSFAYTASDPGGKVSREATVTITILRPTEPTTYTDTLGTDSCFTAEWMRSTGIFSGECVGGNLCFQPEKGVTKGELLTMAVKTLSIPVEDTADGGLSGNLPQWLRPYATAALRAGLTAQAPWSEVWDADEPANGEDAAALLCCALDLDAQGEDRYAALMEREIDLPQGELTRAAAANALYRLSVLKRE